MEIGSAIASTKAGIDLIKAAIAARDDAKAQAAISDTLDRLVSASIASLALLEKLNLASDQLRAAQRALEDAQLKAAERDRYALAEVRPGAYAYASKPVDGENQEPAHWVCQPCFDAGSKVVLRVETNRYEDSVLKCASGNEAHRINLADKRASPLPPVRRG